MPAHRHPSQPAPPCRGRALPRRVPCAGAALRAVAAATLLGLLSACGGGGDDGASRPPPGAAACSVPDQQAWLGDWMARNYFWNGAAPRPDPRGFSTVQAYYDALLYRGGVDPFPADRWSSSQSTESFNRFFGDGQSLGYGLSVAGLEVTGRPDLPLYVRHVEPRSPAGAAGVVRGDRVLTVDGLDVAPRVAADDFSFLSADRVGQTLRMTLRSAVDGSDREVVLSSAVFALTPVAGTQLLTSPGGRRVGLLQVKDMIAQAEAPVAAAVAQFAAAGVQEVVLDLRYNGGGLVSTAAALGSQLAGARGAGRTFATLLYNAQRAATDNRSYAFTTPVGALSLPRVFVLTGARTCSASEQVVNGLRGIGVQVVTVGDTTCGKPVGFLPAGHCGTTYSAVNFESVNDRFEGRYFDGFAPTCAVAEDFTRPLGVPGEPLLDTALRFADTGRCTVAGASTATPGVRALGASSREGGLREGLRDGLRRGGVDDDGRPGGLPGMVAR